MKKVQMLKVAMVILFLCSGLIACSTTPPAAPETPAAAAKDQVSQSDMGQKAEPKGAEQVAPKGDAVPKHDAVADLQRIFFDFDQFTLTDQARGVLAANAKYMAAHMHAKFVVEGHCDERGSDEYNLALGESRALAAKNYLISLGVAADRLSVISYGEEKPLVAGSTEEAWSQNRRAEFKLVH